MGERYKLVFQASQDIDDIAEMIQHNKFLLLDGSVLYGQQQFHFAMFFWTDELLSRWVAERIAAGVEVYGVWDQLGAANVSSQHEMLCAAGAQIGIEDLTGKVHHTFAVIDVEGDDLVMIAGTYNRLRLGPTTTTRTHSVQSR